MLIGRVAPPSTLLPVCRSKSRSCGAGRFCENSDVPCILGCPLTALADAFERLGDRENVPPASLYQSKLIECGRSPESSATESRYMSRGFCSSVNECVLAIASRYAPSFRVWVRARTGPRAKSKSGGKEICGGLGWVENSPFSPEPAKLCR